MTSVRHIFFSLALMLLWSIASSVSAANNYHYQPTIDINKLFQRAIQDRAFPGGCIIAGTKDRVMIKKCFGYHTYSQDVPEQLDDVFDLASLTKVIGTTTAIMKLSEQHKLKLSDKVVRILPEFKGPNRLYTKLKATITIEDLLRHRSGLPEGNPVDQMYNATTNKRLSCLYQTPLKYYPRRKSVYSDINFILLGKIVERISGERLDTYLRRNVFGPLEMWHTAFHPYENACKIVPTYSRQCVGVVHDPVARSLGGICGHAGIFSTAIDLQHFAKMMLNSGRYKNIRFLQEKTIENFSSRDTILSRSTHALGWDMAYRPSGTEVPHQFSAGYYIDANAIGHTGYTGTSLWISRKQGLYVILLTNRVFDNADPSHHRRDRYWRQQITSAVWRNLGFTQQNILYHEL